MNLSEIFAMIKEHGTDVIWFFVINMTLIQITPIKLNPWDKVISWVSGLFFKDINSKITDLNEKVDKISERLDEHIMESDKEKVERKRAVLLDFASAIANGRNYTKEQFEEMLREYDEYISFCKRKKLQNSVIEESMVIVRESYSEHLKNNNFLQGIYYLTPKEVK